MRGLFSCATRGGCADHSRCTRSLSTPDAIVLLAFISRSSELAPRNWAGDRGRISKAMATAARPAEVPPRWRSESVACEGCCCRSSGQATRRWTRLATQSTVIAQSIPLGRHAERLHPVKERSVAGIRMNRTSCPEFERGLAPRPGQTRMDLYLFSERSLSNRLTPSSIFITPCLEHSKATRNSVSNISCFVAPFDIATLAWL